nr:hypothetical protein [Mycobacterium sp. E3298]
MPQFNNLNDLFKHIQSNIVDTLNDEVATEVKFEEQKQIEQVVYEAYLHPFQYERRTYTEGGLQDIDMMVAVVEVKGNECVLSVVNMAKGQNEDIYIAPLIEYGDGVYGEYQYKYNRDNTSWKYLRSRPFTQATIDALLASGKHIKGFKEGMKKRGFDIT